MRNFIALTPKQEHLRTHFHPPFFSIFWKFPRETLCKPMSQSVGIRL